MLIMRAMVKETITSVQLRVETTDTPVVHTVKTRRRSNVTSTPTENYSPKSPSRLARKLVDTIYIEECEERIYTHCEESHERGHHSTRVVDHHSKVVASSDHSGHYESYGGHH
eukprot:TRINITY_DN592_c0_g1_i2.p1 TRINITY_DN592_c0_g1~~TRINITY_DN592_c0_g1_i2.p1  ORF type:complete len:113 (-),score=20.89 TRINITY_DN592_c0_g1_i2:36-374(-)